MSREDRYPHSRRMALERVIDELAAKYGTSDRLEVLYKLVLELASHQGSTVIAELLRTVDKVSRNLYGQPLVLKGEEVPVWRFDKLVEFVRGKVAEWAPQYASPMEVWDSRTAISHAERVARRILGEAMHCLLLSRGYPV